MKLQFTTLLSTTAASMLACTVMAQPLNDFPTDETRTGRQDLPHARIERLGSVAKASNVIGMTVKNNEQEKLGKVDDFILDVESGRVVQVILTSGGFLGMGKTLTAVPPGALHHNDGARVLYLNLTTAAFEAAPKFDTARWNEETQSNQVTEVYGYYGLQPYFVTERYGYPTTNLDGTIAGTLPRHMDGTFNTDGPRTMDKVKNEQIAQGMETTNATAFSRNAEGTWARNHSLPPGKLKTCGSTLGFVQMAGKLMGAPVINLQNEKLGKVENFIVDLSAGRIVAVIISSGGFMGMEAELSAVPPAALRFNPEHDALQMDASKEMLASAPHFNAMDWPDFSQPNFTIGVYHAYQVEPYFSTNAAVAVDNTRQNTRDRDGSTLTPLDQGNNQTDVDITARIRQEIIASPAMSINAKNVKIITIDGRVTLRGPVNSTEEKLLIGEIANRIARAGNVDNLLEVPLTTSSNN